MVDHKENLSTQDLLPNEPREIPESEMDTVDTGAPETVSPADTLAPVPETTPDTKTDRSATDEEEPSQPLFAADEVDGYRENWQSIQIAFVDDPQRAVREADELVAKVIQSLAATFAAHKSELEGQWSRGGEVATEDLRLALRQYRSFFHQLLSA